jgi:hypothetical protein
MSGMMVSGLSVILATPQIRSWTNNVHEPGTGGQGFRYEDIRYAWLYDSNNDNVDFGKIERVGI